MKRYLLVGGVLVLAALAGLGLGLWRQGKLPGLTKQAGVTTTSLPMPSAPPGAGGPSLEDRLSAARHELERLRRRLAEAKAQQERLKRLEAELAACRQARERLKRSLAAAQPVYRYSEPIFFGPGKTRVTRAGLRIVRKAAAEIKSTPGVEVAVEGHADRLPLTPRTKKRYGDNLGISVVRGLNVARELFKQGIPLDRVIVIGYGTSRPMDPSRAPGKKINNRRAVIRQKMPTP